MTVTISETPATRCFIALQRLVGRQERVVADDVAAEMGVTSSYASTLLNRLERMGLAKGRNADEGGFVLWSVS